MKDQLISYKKNSFGFTGLIHSKDFDPSSEINAAIQCSNPKRRVRKRLLPPPIRQAAHELRVSIITVKKAWEELERCGLINTVTGKGCFVAEFSPDEILQIRNETVLKQMVSDASYYKSFGLSVEEVIELLKKIY